MEFNNHLLVVHVSDLPVPLDENGRREFSLLCDATGRVVNTISTEPGSVYVLYEDKHTADNAVIALSGSPICGKEIQVRACEESEMITLTELSGNIKTVVTETEVTSKDGTQTTDNVTSLLNTIDALSPTDKAALLAVLQGVPPASSITQTLPGLPGQSTDLIRPPPGISTRYQGTYAFPQGQQFAGAPLFPAPLTQLNFPTTFSERPRSSTTYTERPRSSTTYKERPRSSAPYT